MSTYVNTAHEPHTGLSMNPVNNEASASGVSWGAVVGGAFVAAALSLILLALGAGLGLSSVSPWSNTGASASTIGKGAIIWFIAIQVIASAMGGYLAGRLRTKWASIHTDEVYFRDTAHGFLVWAVGLVISVYFLASAASSIVSGTADAATQVAGAASQDGASVGHVEYYVDTLFRSEDSRLEKMDVSERAEVERIFVQSFNEEGVPLADRTYLARRIAARTGITQSDAERRLSDVMLEAKKAVDTARKATASLLLWIFLGLLCGAFSASFAATLGGRQRDDVKLN